MSRSFGSSVRCAGVMAAVAGLLMSACGGDTRPSSPTAPIIPSTPTQAQATETPVIGAKATTVPVNEPPPVQYPPPRPAPSRDDHATLASDPLVVYSDEVASVDDGNRTWPVIEIVSYNLRTHRIAGLFRVGTVGELVYDIQTRLVGRSVVINLERRIIVANLDGSGMRDVFTAPVGAIATTFAVSPDGKTVAIGTESSDLRPGPLAFLVLVDLASGTELRRIGSDEFARAGLPGTPGASAWLTDRTVEVYGVAHKGGGGFRPTVIADLNGALELRAAQPPAFNAGRYVGVPSSTVFYGCQGSWPLPLTVELRERASGTPVGTLARDGYVVAFNRPSPDGSSLLFDTRRIQERDRTSGQCVDLMMTGGWHVWSMGGIVAVPDLRPLLQNWDGNRFIDLECEGRPLPLDYPLDERYLVRNSGAATPSATLLVGGEAVSVIHRAAIIGFTSP